jgi:predicted pyridoxine 5'-phosphate oxidase superfamily flavin-nucleotide-binding protein
MSHQFAEIMFTDGVKAAQEEYGSRARLERFAEIAGPNDELTDREAGFIEQRDTFYIATVNEDGWPYVQHRGGPPGFLRVIGPTCLAYADFRGNTQLVSVGPGSHARRERAGSACRRPRGGRATGLSRTGRESRLYRRHRIRLELPAAHYATLY